MDAPIGNRVIQSKILSLDYWFCTHVGHRQHNQDELFVSSTTGTTNGNGCLFGVADGMGGHPGGGFASKMACDRMNDFYEKTMRKKEKQNPVDISRQLVEAAIRADRAIRVQGLQNNELKDMGTTLSCLIITETHSVIAHVGDTRIYRLRKGRLSCLTVDHTFVQDMIFEGEVDPKQAHLHPLRHMLTRAVGCGEPLELVDTRIDVLKANDRFLLCTDGLYNAVAKRGILDLLAQRSITADTAAELVARALQNAARDNITAVVVKIKSIGDSCLNTEQ